MLRRANTVACGCEAMRTDTLKNLVRGTPRTTSSRVVPPLSTIAARGANHAVASSACQLLFLVNFPRRVRSPAFAPSDTAPPS
jgi:hypothetical protein